MASEIKLPALKENVDTVEVNAVKVRPATTVAKDQALLEVQADKAALDVPSPMAGRVTKVLRQGRRPDQGRPGLSASSNGGNGEAGQGRPPPAKTGRPQPPPPRRSRNRRRAAAPKPDAAASRKPAAAPPSPAPRRAGEPPRAGRPRHAPAGPRARRRSDARSPAAAGPAASSRRTSRRYVRQLASGGGRPGAPAPACQAPPLPNFEEWGPVERAAAVADPQGDRPADEPGLEPDPARHAARPGRHHRPGSVPQAAAGRQGAEADRDRVRPQGRRPSRCSEFPTFNASLDLAGNQLILKRYYHIGVAVDTENGLLVPVLRDVDKKSVARTGRGADGRRRARPRSASSTADELKGGTFTITNLGGIGGTGFTPIVN